MDPWLNKAVDGGGIFYTRIISSWIRVKYDGMGSDPEFREWLKTLKINGQHLSDETIREICFLKDNGKMELENSARKFITEKENWKKENKLFKQ